MEALIAKRLLIRGRVQGVGYREAMRREAEQLGLSGWVRNRSDNSVEAVVHGPAEVVAQLMDWASRGPRFAAVSSVEESQAEMPASQGFEILPSL
jgi:acylphosphatase